MFLARCRLRCGPPTIASLALRRSLSFSRPDPSLLTRIVVERANHYIENLAPHAISGYFKATVLQESIPEPVRLQASEALLNLLFRKRFFDQAFKILRALHGQHMQFSAPIRAKALTVQFIHGLVKTMTYFHNLDKLLRHPEFVVGEEAEGNFLDILHLLTYPGSSPSHLETVVGIYLDVRGKDYTLHSSAIALLIASHLGKGNEADAMRWLDRHSKRPTPDSTMVDPTFCLPYTVFVQKGLFASPEKEPHDVYGPILDRMYQDCAWPDSVFMNVLISAELEHNHYRRALLLYGTLRSHTSHGVYPDETTYSKLFNAASNLASFSHSAESGRIKRALFPKSRRKLFREMAEVQSHIKHERLPFLTPVITKVSLGAALQMFVTHKDYAAAIIILKVFEALHIPLEQRVMDMVLTSIVQRCQKELTSVSDEKPWADIFLDLRGIPRRRVKGVSEWEMRRRVISVARRALAIAEARDREPPEEEKPKKQEPTETDPDYAQPTTGRSSESNPGAVDGGSEQEGVSSELSETPEQEEQPSPKFRTEKKLRMRERRFRLIDVLLSRALETSIVLQGHIDPEEPARKAVNDAYVDMLVRKDEK